MNIERFLFEIHGDDKGSLISIEESRTIPFHIKRVYYMYGTKNNVIRGCHAHKMLQQVLICVHGNCKIVLDDGKERETVLLNQPNEGILIPHSIWREIYDFSSDAVLIVLASEFYDESDYIRDYNEFLNYVNRGY